MCIRDRGWFDHWGKPKNGGSTEGFTRELKWMLETNVSPNLFMVHGGTSFGFMNGANWEGAYTPAVTTYDYGAPLSENGTLTDRYRTFRQTIQDYYGDTYKPVSYTHRHVDECAAELVSVQHAVQIRGPDTAFAVAAGGAVFPEHDGIRFLMKSVTIQLSLMS